MMMKNAIITMNHKKKKKKTKKNGLDLSEKM